MHPKPNPKAAEQYLRTRVMTATPEQLQMMLYDGVVRFAEQARTALAARDFEQTYVNTTKAQRIVSELLATLKHDRYPELCKKLAGLYAYIHRRLTEAGANHNAESLDEAIELLKYQRETWSLLLDDVGKQKASAAAKTMQFPQPDERMEARISMSA